MARKLFHHKPNTLKNSVFLASLLMVIQMVLFGGGASFAGQNISQSLAMGVLGFYPLEAALELLKIWVFSIILSLWFLSLLDCYRTRWERLGIWVLAGVVFILFTLATLIRYPAMFEADLPVPLRRAIFELSFEINPFFLEILASLLILGTLGYTVLRQTFCLTPVVLCIPALLWGALQFGLEPTPSGSHGEDSQAKPLVLFIAVDSLRQDSITESLTPNLFSLYRDPQVVSFEDHHVGVPRTFPSWIEILRGQYAPATKVRNMFPSFKSRQGPKHDLILDLRQIGYEPVVISDFAGDIFGRFESGFAGVEAPTMNLQTLIRMSCDQLFPFYYAFMLSSWGSYFFPALKENPANADPYQISNRAMSTLSSSTHSPASTHFLTLFFSTAHFPYAAPWPYYSKFSSPAYRGAFPFQKNPNMKALKGPISETEKAQIKGLYHGSIQSIDTSLGSLFSWLKKHHLWENTLILVTADHGEEFFEVETLHHGHGEHLRGPHVLQVPWLMKLPSSKKPHTNTVKSLSRSIDIYPTVLGVLGMNQLTTPNSGLDLSPLFLTENPPRALGDLSAYSETEIWFSRDTPGSFQKDRMLYPNINELLVFDQGHSGEIVLNPKFEKLINTAKHRSLTKGDYKFIALPTDRGMEYRLYDRRRDPLNQKNIADEQPELFQNMKNELYALLKQMEPDSLHLNEYVLNP